jgi:hypothetical protein
VLDLLDLVELEELGDPAFAIHKATLLAHFHDLLLQRVEIYGFVVHAREDIGEETARVSISCIPLACAD